jgi:NAD(P)-dependent dehydrogenase (short-subunit alcohol dehydrogenase family)
MLSLDGKTAIITGSAAGIGERTARLFEELGARVLSLDVDEERGARLEKRSAHGRIQFRKVDLRDRGQVLEFVRWAEENVETVDVLINNAGRASRNNIFNIALEEWDSMVSLSLTAPLLLSRFAANKMIHKGVRGKIIMISAIQALRPLESSFGYSIVKGGLLSMTRSLAIDLGPHGIQVTAVLPGPIYTADRNRFEDAPESLDKRSATLLGRMGKRTEVANLLAFLASDMNTFMTGNLIAIDGGRLISRKPDPEEITKGNF